jgi:nucleoside-diphosphate-sugar epimerase
MLRTLHRVADQRIGTIRQVQYNSNRYVVPSISPPNFSNDWREDPREVFKRFKERFQGVPLVSIGTGIIAQGLHEIARVNDYPFRIGGIDNGLDITSKQSVQGFLSYIIRSHKLKRGDRMAIFNGAAYLSANPNIAGSIDVNVGGAINLIVIAQQIKAEHGIDLVILTPSSIARDQPDSPYGIGKRLVEKFTSFQNLSTSTDFRSVILPGLISGLSPSGGSTDTYDALANHVAHLVLFNEAASSDKSRVAQNLGTGDNQEFVSFVRTNRKVAMAGIKDVSRSIIEIFSLDSLPRAIPICGGPSMSYSVDDAALALKNFLCDKYPSFKVTEKLGVQQKNLEEWGPIGIELPNVDSKHGISTVEESLEESMVSAYLHYRQVAEQQLKK